MFTCPIQLASGFLLLASGLRDIRYTTYDIPSSKVVQMVERTRSDG